MNFLIAASSTGGAPPAAAVGITSGSNNTFALFGWPAVLLLFNKHCGKRKPPATVVYFKVAKSKIGVGASTYKVSNRPPACACAAMFAAGAPAAGAYAPPVAIPP